MIHHLIVFYEPYDKEVLPMLRKSAVVFLSLCYLVLFFNPAWGLDFKPGMYKITSSVEMPGMPAGSVPPQTITQCLTELDPVPNKDVSGQPCNIKDMNQKGNTITWKMECEQQGQKMTSDGQIQYSGDSFEGTIKTKMGPEAGNMTVKTVVSGSRIGDCQ